MLITDEQKTTIRDIAKQYGIELKGNNQTKDINTLKCLTNTEHSLEEIHLARLGMFSHIAAYTEGENSSLQIAEFISMLGKAMKHNTGIETTITIKGIKENRLLLIDRQTLYNLWLYSNTLLEKNQDGEYQYEFGWDFKQPFEHEEQINYTEPYTEDELEKIITYEKQKEKNRKKNQKVNQILKRKIQILRRYYIEEGIFSSNTKELTINEYQFLYDTLVVLGVFPATNKHPLSKNDKKKALRDYIRER